MRETLRTIGVLPFMALLAIGCSKGDDPSWLPVHKVEGKVVYNGQTVPGALVVLHPADGDPKLPRPRGYVRPDGSFVVSTYKTDDGAPIGEYKVTVEWRKAVVVDGDAKPGPNVLPSKYGNPRTSGVVVRIAEGTNQLTPIELRR